MPLNREDVPAQHWKLVYYSVIYKPRQVRLGPEIVWYSENRAASGATTHYFAIEVKICTGGELPILPWASPHISLTYQTNLATSAGQVLTELRTFLWFNGGDHPLVLDEFGSKYNWAIAAHSHVHTIANQLKMIILANSIAPAGPPPVGEEDDWTRSGFHVTWWMPQSVVNIVTSTA